MMRAVIYARYSSDNQSEASIEDQLRICKAAAARQGWRAPSMRMAIRSGAASNRASSGPSASPATAGWWSRPTPTVRSAGIACPTGLSCSPSCCCQTAATGWPGRRRAITGPAQARTAYCAGRSTAGGIQRLRAFPFPTFRALFGKRAVTATLSKVAGSTKNAQNLPSRSISAATAVCSRALPPDPRF